MCWRGVIKIASKVIRTPLDGLQQTNQVRQLGALSRCAANLVRRSCVAYLFGVLFIFAWNVTCWPDRSVYCGFWSLVKLAH